MCRPQSFARRTLSGFGRVFSALALLVQLSAAVHAMAVAQAADTFEAAIAAAICHADPADPNTSQTPSRQPEQPCDLCPLCAVASQAHALLTPPDFVIATPPRIALAIVYGAENQPSARIVILRRSARDPPFTV